MFDVECPKCGKVLGTATSNKMAGQIVGSHIQEDHKSIFEMF